MAELNRNANGARPKPDDRSRTPEDDGVKSSVLALNRVLGQVFERFLADATWSHTA